MQENIKKSSKKNKFFNFFIQNFNHYDSLINKRYPKEIFITTSQTLSNIKSPKLKLVKTDIDQSLKTSYKAQSFEENLIKSMKSREHTTMFSETEIPKIKSPTTLHSEKPEDIELTSKKTKTSESENLNSNNLNENICMNNKKNNEIKHDFLKYLNYLSETNGKTEIDKKTWKSSIFNKLKPNFLEQRKSIDIFNIYSMHEQRPSFINELNYRLHYRRNIQKKTKTQANLLLKNNNKNVFPSIISPPKQNLKIRKKSPEIKNLFDKNKNKAPIQASEQSKRLRINISQPSLKPLEISSSSGNKSRDIVLPSDERTRYILYPMVLLKSISEHLNYFKNTKNQKFFYDKLDQIIGSSLILKRSLLDIKNKKVVEPLSPRSLFFRFILNEKNVMSGLIYDDLSPKTKKNHVQRVFFDNPFKKLHKDTVMMLIEFNGKLEQSKINSEKQKMDNFKASILEEHSKILSEELQLIEKYKNTKKKELYRKMKQALLDREKLNISVPNSDIYKELKKAGHLKFIKNDNIVTLEEFEQFLLDIKNSQMKINDEID